MKFKIITLGCKVNCYESEIMSEKLTSNGYILCDDVNDSDIIIINTCSVTNMADNKSKKMIRSSKLNNPNSILVVCGCMAQNHQEKLHDLNIDILIGNKDKSRIVELINEYRLKKEKYIKFYDLKNVEFENMTVDYFSTHTRAFIKIQDGCNNYCSYCIIPYLRGNIRSKDINKALEEAKTLVENGHKEIVLTGIHTGSYGFGENFDLVDLIEKMSLLEGLERIRISSIEITEINEKFLNMLKNNNKVCNHLHIPLQSGSRTILKYMNRKYNKEKYETIINNIRSIRPDISITTDVIVGFPNETEELFEESLEFCKKMKFSKIHVFPYSKREGTKAAEMNNHLNNEIKKCRAKKLIQLSENLEKDYNKLFLNKKCLVLIEENKENLSIGHTSNYLKVIIDKVVCTNKTYEVVIKEVGDNYVKGELIN